MLFLFLLWMLYLRGSADTSGLRKLHDTKLLNTTSEYEGIVSVAVYSQSALAVERYIVCAGHMDMQDANVVCRQLGFSKATHIEAVHYTQPKKRWLLNVTCNGSEAILQHCAYKEANGNVCINSLAARVKCEVDTENQQRFEIRLIDGNASGSIVQIYGRGHWSPVCTEKVVFEEISQNIVCRELGFGKAVSGRADMSLDNYTGDIYVGLTRCEGDEFSLKQCDLGWGSMDKTCGNGNLLGIKCADTKVPTFDLCSNQDFTTDESWVDGEGKSVFAAFFHSPGYPNMLNYTGNTTCNCEVMDGEEDATIKVYIHYRMFENSFNESITLHGTKAESNSDSNVTIDGATSNVGTYTYKAREFSVMFSSEGMSGSGKFRIQLRATKKITYACSKLPVSQPSTPSSTGTVTATMSSSPETVTATISSYMGTVGTTKVSSQTTPTATWAPSRVRTGTTVPGSSSESSSLPLILGVSIPVIVVVIAVLIIVTVCLIRKKKRPEEKARTTNDDYEIKDLELFDIETDGGKKNRTNVSDNDEKEMKAYGNKGMVDADLNESSAPSSDRAASIEEKQPRVIPNDPQFSVVPMDASEAALSPIFDGSSNTSDGTIPKNNPANASPANITSGISNDESKKNELVCVISANADPSGIYAEVGGTDNGPTSNKRYPAPTSYENVEINPITENTSHPTKSKAKSKSKKKSSDKHKKNKSKKQTGKERNVEVSNSGDNSTIQITSDNDTERHKAGPIYADVVPKSKRKKESEDDYDLLDRSLSKSLESPAVPPKTEDEPHEPIYSLPDRSQSRIAANDIRTNEESGDGVYGKLKFPSVKAANQTPPTANGNETYSFAI